MATRNVEPKITATEAADLEARSGSDVPDSVDAADPVIDGDEIARLAYSYWEARGFCGGSAEEDWYRAEEEFRKRTLPANRLAG